MSKELINEIESKIAWNDMNINETSISLGDVKRLLNELDEQAERVEELELEINDWRAEVQKWQQFYEESEESHLEALELLKSIVNQNKRLRKALEFYAGGNHYSSKLYDNKIILLDDGEIARKALEGENNDC